MICRCQDCDHAGAPEEGCNHYGLSDFLDAMDRDPKAITEALGLGREISDWRDGAVEWEELHAIRHLRCPGFERRCEHPLYERGPDKRYRCTNCKRPIVVSV